MGNRRNVSHPYSVLDMTLKGTRPRVPSSLSFRDFLPFPLTCGNPRGEILFGFYGLSRKSGLSVISSLHTSFLGFVQPGTHHLLDNNIHVYTYVNILYSIVVPHIPSLVFDDQLLSRFVIEFRIFFFRRNYSR